MRIAAALSVLAVSSACLAQQSTVARFDGAWDVTIYCGNLDDGTRGYTYNFVAEVKDGTLRAQHRAPDSPGSLRVAGKIAADGIAELSAHGRTGNPDYAFKRPSEGSPYSFRIKAKFDATRGTGERIDARPCSLTFVKR